MSGALKFFGGTNGTPFSWGSIMNKLQKITFIIFMLAYVSTAEVSADVTVAESSAQLVGRTKVESDYREEILRNYLEGHNSPLSEYSGVFINLADKYRLDWRLVPAITGVESTFGKRIPINSYNAYGWANGGYSFESWDESIEVVSKALRNNYIDRGAVSINDIARIYAPPSETWARNVKFFMNKIDPLPVSFSLEG
ncbi:hypothetical protein DRH13_05820 [Candidatus Woesebacteria bacterium]|nr:MAG: hypothetical protein DRH13_05820 [Candidatus Woesebacteria bacterium]